MSANDKWVCRFSVDETAKHKNGFTIYKISSVLFPIQSPEAVTSVSVWKRYSDVQRLHKSMRALHVGLHLRGVFPILPRYSYFKRFQPEVIQERAKTLKALLEFVAEHRLLFTSTEFVNFLQTGYPEPEAEPGGVINAIRSSLHLPIEETPPLEYQTDDDDARSPSHTARPTEDTPISVDEADFISQIPIYQAADVEIRELPKSTTKTESFESLSSIESIDSDLYDELNKLTIKKSKPSVKKTVLPDLINFDVPSTSKFEDYHTMPNTGNTDSETVSLSSNMESASMCELGRGSRSKQSLYSKRSVLSLSNVECKTKTEDSYVFEAGYMLNLAARCEDVGDFQRAFDCYKSGIEKMLIGVQSDTDPQRRALIKEKTNKYLSYAEEIYRKHLCDAEQPLLSEQDSSTLPLHCPIPISMLKRPYEDLALYRVLAVLGTSMMLVLHRSDKKCYAMKVIQKVPNNLTEFDEYFLQRTSETRSPTLPTVIPYMVPLHAYIETNNLMFLLLGCAPGQKLFEYIKNYAKSIPNTPAREVNLENVFAEPKLKSLDAENNVKIDQQLDDTVGDTEYVDNKMVESKDCDNNARSSVDELVLNSQKLLLNVDKVLSDVCVDLETVDDNVSRDEGNETDGNNKLLLQPHDVIPPSAICKWGAELLTALESLHNSGVVCRDLNPTNILLGERGQIILTYFYSYPGLDMTLSKLRSAPDISSAADVNMYIAPELYLNSIIDEGSDCPDNACDFWSFGAVMYQLICGVPLSYYHRTLFTTHTILELPDGTSVEEESLLTQLLTYSPAERLGCGTDGIDEIKRHPYFKHIDWQCIYDSWIVPD